jgi:hypothetical protein
MYGLTHKLYHADLGSMHKRISRRRRNAIARKPST